LLQQLVLVLGILLAKFFMYIQLPFDRIITILLY
jgi:hypothetical protein